MPDSTEESALIAQIARSVVRDFYQLYPPGACPVRRQAHPKTHSCVRAEFHVASDLEDDLRHGLFGVPRSYGAWVRFSSGSPKMQSDRRPDIHGMAVKLVGVPGAKLLDDEAQALTQDFVMANSPVYFIRDLRTYAEFSAALADGRLPQFVFGGRAPCRRLRELALLLRPFLQPVANPLQTKYWSQTPYRLGPHAVKFAVFPRPLPLPVRPIRTGPAPLQDTMQKVLETQGVEFDFCVQTRTHPEKMPLEDATVEWPALLSPYRQVASLWIPPQTFKTPAQMQHGEDLSFTPWHSLPEHRPLGAINRARLGIYRQISILRHERNGVRREEPTTMDLPGG